MPRKHYKSTAFVQPKTRNNTKNQTPTHTASTSVTRLRPQAVPGADLGREYPLKTMIADQKLRYFENAKLRKTFRATARAGYDKDWGDAIVDQNLADDPAPINGGAFHPVKRWVVIYRTAEGGLDGTHNVTVSDIRSAISGFSTEYTPFIIRKLHIWIAPNTVNTHFSGFLLTKDDPDNGILGGQYSDIAPYGEFVKFRIRYKGEGYVSSSTDAATKQIFSIGGSAKWNGVVYALIECFD